MVLLKELIAVLKDFILQLEKLVGEEEKAFPPAIPVTIPPPAPPTPPPPPSPAVPAGVNSPTTIENFKYGDDGVWTTLPDWYKTAASLGFKLTNIGYGKQVTVKFERCAKYPRTGNLKMLRCWTGGPGHYTNFYVGQPGGASGSWLFVYTESLEQVKTKSLLGIDAAKYPVGDGKWHAEEYRWQYPSAFGKSDGKFVILIDGQTILSSATWQCEGPSTDPAQKQVGLPNFLCIQDDPSGTPLLPADSFSQIKHISIDVS